MKATKSAPFESRPRNTGENMVEMVYNHIQCVRDPKRNSISMNTASWMSAYSMASGQMNIYFWKMCQDQQENYTSRSGSSSYSSYCPPWEKCDMSQNDSRDVIVWAQENRGGLYEQYGEASWQDQPPLWMLGNGAQGPATSQQRPAGGGWVREDQ